MLGYKTFFENFVVFLKPTRLNEFVYDIIKTCEMFWGRFSIFYRTAFLKHINQLCENVPAN